MNDFKLCLNGHYYRAELDHCPYCKNDRTTTKKKNTTVFVCPICGTTVPVGEKCPYCDVAWNWQYNDSIDSECASLICVASFEIREQWNDAVKNYIRWLSCYREYLVDAPYPDDPHQEQIRWLISHHNKTVTSQWYRSMHTYIDMYTKKITERRQCYKYGLPELDKKLDGLSLHNDEEYNKIFCELKSSIIHQDYGLRWFSPMMLERNICPSCDYVIAPEENICEWCGTPHDWEYNDNIDPECKDWFPAFCMFGGPYREVDMPKIMNMLHMLREQAIKRNIEASKWYSLMQMYIDEYTMKIIESGQCYKYGLPELDRNYKNLKPHHIFWKLKKAIIKQDYGLDWQTPEEQFEEVKTNYLLRT